MKNIEARLAKDTLDVQAAGAHLKPAKFLATGIRLETRQ